MKKIAVMIYPYFSLQEITCLTAGLAIYFGEKIDYLAAEKKIYESEDGFLVTPTKTFDEVIPSEYDCIILPGIINPLPALFDERNIAFLKHFKGNQTTTIAAISSAPLLLAKAGLLDDHHFAAGLFMQMLDLFSFIPKENFVHQPLLEDGNVITGIGFAFREFAECVLRQLGYDPGDHFMSPVTKTYTEEELTFYWEESDYQEFQEELKDYLN